MSIFGRFGKMVQAKANDALDNIEDPISLCNQKIRDMEEKYREAEISSAQVIGNAHAAENELNKAKEEVKDWADKAQLAVDKGNDDLAKKALVRKHEAEEREASLQTSYDTAHAQSEKLKTSLMELKEEIDRTRHERDELEARYKTAEASQKVNEIMADVSPNKNDISMESLRRKVEKKEAMAAGLGEVADIKQDSLEDEFENLKKSSFDADAELEKLKHKPE